VWWKSKQEKKIDSKAEYRPGFISKTNVLRIFKNEILVHEMIYLSPRLSKRRIYLFRPPQGEIFEKLFDFSHYLALLMADDPYANIKSSLLVKGSGGGDFSEWHYSCVLVQKRVNSRETQGSAGGTQGTISEACRAYYHSTM
jgi:hypothetical protein